MNRTAGFTLVEMLLGLVIFTFVMAGAMSFLTAQSRGFRRGDQEMSTLLNLSYGADHLHAHLRTAGANVAFRQPLLVYAGPSAFSFNADYASNDAGDISAVYVDPDAPPEETQALQLADQISIPGSVPAFAYPSIDYSAAVGVNSLAETISFFFQADAETPRGDDFLLLRQVNGQPPEPLVRNIVRDSVNLPFFRYFKLRIPPAGQPGAGQAVLALTPAVELPVRHTVTGHGSAADAGSRIDSLRSVLVSYMVTNGLQGALERRQRISLTIPLSNMGLRELKICGSPPVLGQGLAATFDNSTGINQIILSWNRAFDEDQGERDVVRYVIWRRDVSDPDWSDPLTSVSAAGLANYSVVDQELVPGTTYEYRLAAQDCTPRLSGTSTSNQVPIP